MPGSNYRYSATFNTTYTEDQLLLNSSPFANTTSNAHNADSTPNPLQALIEADSKLHLTSLGQGSECSFSCSGSSAGSPRHARSSSVDSLDSNCGGGSSVGSGSLSRQLSIDGTPNTEHIPTRLSTKLVCKPAHNPLQFVKINSPLSKEAEEQMKLAKEIKKVKEPLFEEDWQTNLDNWKSRRRKSTERTSQRIDDFRWLEEGQGKHSSGRKTKTFSEMLEKRGHRSRYNLSLYTDSKELDDDDDLKPSSQKSSSDQESTEKSSSSVITVQGNVRDGDSDSSFNNNADDLNNLNHNTDKFSDLESSPNKQTSKQINLEEEEEERTNQDKGVNSPSLQQIVPSPGQGCKESDSGLDSLCSSHRTLPTLATDSDFSQDGGSSLDCEMDLGVGGSHLTTGVELLKEFSSKPSSPAPPARKFAPPHKEFEDGSGLELYLRVSLHPPNDNAPKDFGFTVAQKDVLIVDTLSPGSASEQAGLRVGDRILAVNGEELIQESDLPLLLQEALEAGHLELLVWRHTTTSNLTRQWHRNQSKILIDKATSEENLLKNKKNKNRNSLVSKHKSAFETATAQSKEEVKNPEPPIRDAKFHEKVKSFERLSIQEEEEVAAIRKPAINKKPPLVPHKPKVQPYSNSSGKAHPSHSLENVSGTDIGSEPVKPPLTVSSPLEQKTASPSALPQHSPPAASKLASDPAVEQDHVSTPSLSDDDKTSSQKEDDRQGRIYSYDETSYAKQLSPINTSGLNIIYQSPPPSNKPEKNFEQASSPPISTLPCSPRVEEDLYNLPVVLDPASYIEEETAGSVTAVEPPKEKPPPPPPCSEEEPLSTSPPKDNIVATKKIKKELRRRRTDFLGIDSPEEINSSNENMKPPPTMEEILMKERDSLREMSRHLASTDKDLSSLGHWNSSYSKDVEERLMESDQKIRSLQAERRRVQGERLRGQGATWDPLHPTSLPNNEGDGEEDYSRLHDELSLWQREESLRMQEESLRREREQLYLEQEALRREREHYQKQLNQMTPHYPLSNGHIGHKPAPPTMPVRPTPPEKPERLKPVPPPIHHPKPVPQRAVKPIARQPNSNPWPVQRPPLPHTDRGANIPTYQVPKKRNSLESLDGSKYNQNHWLIQEAEMRRIAELKEHKSPEKRQGMPPSEFQNSYNILPPPYSNKPLAPAKSLPSDLNKPSQELSQKTSSTSSLPHSSDKKLSVSGRKRCSNCDKELGKGAAMIIQSLELYYHVACFQCCVCRTQLGNGDRGTDVRVRNGKIHCQACFSNDEAGLQFTQV